MEAFETKKMTIKRQCKALKDAISNEASNGTRTYVLSSDVLHQYGLLMREVAMKFIRDGYDVFNIDDNGAYYSAIDWQRAQPGKTGEIITCIKTGENCWKYLEDSDEMPSTAGHDDPDEDSDDTLSTAGDNDPDEDSDDTPDAAGDGGPDEDSDEMPSTASGKSSGKKMDKRSKPTSGASSDKEADKRHGYMEMAKQKIAALQGLN